MVSHVSGRRACSKYSLVSKPTLIAPIRHNAPYRFGSSRSNSGTGPAASPSANCPVVHTRQENKAPMMFITACGLFLTIVSAKRRLATNHCWSRANTPGDCMEFA